MAHINIYSADYTRISDDFHFGYGSFYTNKKAAQADCDRMNAIHLAKHPEGDGWEYIVHKHTAFSF